MSTGETGGLDLTVETLQFIYDHWAGVAGTFTQASDQGWLYDNQLYDSVTSGSAETWTRPVLRNHDNKTLYPGGETNGYTAQLRNNDVVTVEDGGRVDGVTGTEFDFDVEHDVDVTCEAVPANGFSVIGDTTDWRAFVNIVRNAIMTERFSPITDPNCKYDWRWITVADESTLPEAEDNRDHYGTEVTIRWHGYESLPAI